VAAITVVPTIRRHSSLLCAISSVPLAIGLALAVAKAVAAQTPMERCTSLVAAMAWPSPSDGQRQRYAYQRCLADPAAFTRRGDE